MKKQHFARSKPLEATLEKLNEQEWKDFKIFCKNDKKISADARSLLSYLIKSKNWSDALTTPKIFFRKELRRGYHAEKYPLIKSDLAKALHRFFIQQKLQADPYLLKFIELQIARERYSTDHYQKNLTAYRKQLQQDQSASIWNLYHFMRFEHYIYYQAALIKREDKKHLEQAYRYLDNFATGLKLRYAAELITHSRYFNHVNIETPPLENLRQTAIHPDYQMTVTQLYRLIFEMIYQEQKEDFLALYNFTLLHSDVLADWDMTLALVYTNNFCARRIREHQDEYYIYSLKLYQIQLAKKHFDRINRLEKGLYISITNTACAVKAFDWVGKFIEEYRHLLIPNEEPHAYKLAKTRYLFDKGDYQAALAAVQEKTTAKGFDLLQERVLLFRILYKLGFATTYLINEIKKYLRYIRKKEELVPAIWNGYINFIELLALIIEEEIGVAEVKEKIDNTEPLILKNWLLSEIGSPVKIPKIEESFAATNDPPTGQ